MNPVTPWFAASILLAPEPSVDCQKLAVWPMIHYLKVTHGSHIEWDEKDISMSEFTAYLNRESVFARKHQRDFPDLFLVRRDRNSASVAELVVREIKGAGLKFDKNCPKAVD
ncbi:MAG TPA: hypothetical protein VHY79_15395 [Rhizomicrobium sp.]|jgi:hypothetical protein|nr:hypothetical protein [Rhizomicrobium sp.]